MKTMLDEIEQFLNEEIQKVALEQSGLDSDDTDISQENES